MSKVICNIPHSSTMIPSWAKKDIICSQDELDVLVDFITDKDVDRLWEFVPSNAKQIAEVSRVIVDTERFRNDEDEEMSALGMGLYYTHDPYGNRFRIKNEQSYQKCLFIYDNYHKSLEEKAGSALTDFGKCVILDCHSFHDEMKYTGTDPSEFPDVCIGVNGNVTKEAEAVINFFTSKGYSVKTNTPFSGSIVPLKYFNDSRITSIMIELNRRIYQGESFTKIQDICKKIYTQLSMDQEAFHG